MNDSVFVMHIITTTIKDFLYVWPILFYSQCLCDLRGVHRGSQGTVKLQIAKLNYVNLVIITKFPYITVVLSLE